MVVTFEAGYFAQQYVQETGITWPLLIDETKKVYHDYGMLTASFLDIWGPSSMWAYMKELCHGRLPKKSHGDIAQRGGDVLIDPQGIVRLHHVGKGPADRPPVAEIVNVLKKRGKE
jgi:alkyl hydroperoxide reductase subunit AhpC